jgi:hypothetical protein
VRVVNRGRGSGVIHQVAVIDAKYEVPSAVEGFANGVFTPVALPSFSAMRLIIMAPDKQFTRDHRVKVDWWDGGQIVEPVHVKGVGFYGLKSVLPPKA